jgi:hypothetical protein
MVLINLGDSQDSMDGSGASELGGLVMERSQSSASSYESNPEVGSIISSPCFVVNCRQIIGIKLYNVF